MTIRTILGTLTLLLIANAPLKAENCTPLRVVGGEGTQVKKTVSQPGLIVVRDNWNTDFAVAGDRPFRRYIAILRSESKENANFSVEMHLKYSDGTSDEPFQGNIELSPGESENITGSPRVDQQPYQINLSVGGVGAVGKAYTLSVRGCN